uniref:MSP domain-containing protein n=1 Tax=Rhabditophanes sp. KR3021 TaxID=114890 RepID=A0AC35TLB3_9BILA
MTQTQQYLMVNTKGSTVMDDEFMQRKNEFEMNLSYKIGSLKKDSPDYIGVYEAEWHTNENINADSLTSNSTSSGSDSEKSKSSDNYCSPSSKRSKLNYSPSISSLNKEITKRGVSRMQKNSCTDESKGNSGGYQFTIMKNVHIPRTSYLHYNNKDTKYSYDVFDCISMSNGKYIPEQSSNVEMQFTHQPRGVFNKGDPIYCDKHSNKCNNLLNLQASDKTKIFKTFAAKFENGSSVNEVVYINSTFKTVVSRTIAVKNPNPGMKRMLIIVLVVNNLLLSYFHVVHSRINY